MSHIHVIMYIHTATVQYYVEGAGIPSIEYMSLCGGGGKLECLCGKAGASCVRDGSTHSSGCVVNGSIIVYIHTKKLYSMYREGAGVHVPSIKYV